MKYTYATLLLSETGAEINEQNLVAVLESTGTDVSASRVKATIAALEGVDIPTVAGSLPTDGDDPAVPEADEFEPPESSANGDERAPAEDHEATESEEPAATDGGRAVLSGSANGETTTPALDSGDDAAADEAPGAGQ
jgi:large subunit ribosomal protein L12